jgi:zinc protease
MRASSVLFAAALAVATVASASAQTKTPARTAEPRKWEHETSDLKPDPRFNFGALKNGMRYVWFKNDEPKKQVFMRLHVDVGSLVETETELGIAHFIEHMAFNGTRNFKAGTLVETFNKEGIKFGHDVNAHTGMDETVYELDLPDDSAERLTTAFKWFRDVADGLKFEQAEVNSEKGVVDAEERDRGGEGFKHYVDFLSKMLDGTLKPKRLPIGVKSVRDKFTPKICFGFYRKWYRPEHMTFVMGGDLGDLDPTKEIEKAFGTIPVPKDPLPARPNPGKPTFATKAIAEPGGGMVQVTVAMLRPYESRPDDTAARTASVTRTLAESMLTRRLTPPKEGEDPLKAKLPPELKKLLRTVGGSADWFSLENLVEGPSVRVISDKSNWRIALMNAEREIRRAVEKGFDDKELNLAYVEFDKTLVPRPVFPKPDSREFLNDLLRACNERYVPMEDRADKESYKPGERARSVAACQKYLKDVWSTGQLVFIVNGDAGLGDDPWEDLKTVWDQAHATTIDKPLDSQIPGLLSQAKPAEKSEPDKKVGTPAPDGPGPDMPDGEKAGEGDAPKADKESAAKAKDWAYAQKEVRKTPDGVEVKRDEELKVSTLTYKNGVRAIYKHLDERRGFGRFEVRFGEGVLPLDPAKADLAWLASETFMECGLAKNDWKSVRAAIGSGTGNLDFKIDGDACVFSGVIFGDNLQRTFEVICAYLTDPGWRQEGFDEFRKKMDEKLKKNDAPTLQRFLSEFQHELANGDRRFLPPEKANVDPLTLDDVKGFLAPQLDGPVTIVVLGSKEGYKIENGLNSTFANLPQRRAARDFASHRQIAPRKTGVFKKEFCETGAASALIHMVFPTTDGIDVPTRRRLALLEDILDDRLRIEIREKKSLAYSPRADSSFSEHWKGLGAVTLNVEVDEKKIDEATKAITDMMVNLGAKGVTAAEVDRLKTAALGNADKWLEDESFWWDVLADAVNRPAALDEVKNLKHWYDAATVPEMNALCKQYFTKDKASVFVAMPKK